MELLLFTLLLRLATVGTSAEEVDPCSMHLDAGPCRALLPRYFYNASADLCEPFTYGGCGGNENNFNTLEECQMRCEKSFRNGSENDDRPIVDCRVKGCPPCHDCSPSNVTCPKGKRCPEYLCKNRCGLCEQCTDDGLCVDSRPRWCKFFKPCQVRTCPTHPEANCVQLDCDCFNAFFRLTNGTMLSWADCRRV
uniref:BPTI/Kunitz inhibitor domain-containing protein n=1 Tax=Trichuris muris TaxID=70415 RepID=A0A5S6QET2_TRIMR